jgi:hypothetical protein
MIAASIHGSKHTCTNCNNRFYDLNKLPVVCLKCEFILVVPVKLPAASAYMDRKTAQRQSKLRRLAEKRKHNVMIGKVYERL